MKLSKSTLLAALAFSFGTPHLLAQNIGTPNSAELKAKTSAPAFDGAPDAGGQAINLGQLALAPSAYYRYTTGDNFRSSPGRTAPTDISEFGLRLNGSIGSSWTVAYDPRWTEYSNGVYEDQFSQRFNVAGTLNIGEWQTAIAQSYSEDAPFLSETSLQTSEEIWATQLSGSYMINSVLSARIGIDYRLRDSEGFNSSEGTAFNVSISRSYASRLNTALILTKGYENVNTNFDADFEQVSVSAGYQPSDKVYVSASLGWEERSFNVGAASDLGNAIYSLELNYSPAEFTGLSIRSDSSVGASLFSNQTFENENIGIYLSQRMLGWVQLDLGYGERAVSYQSALLANLEVRADDTTFFDARLSASILDEKVDVSLFYREQQNDSDSALYEYDGDQHGVEISYSF